MLWLNVVAVPSMVVVVLAIVNCVYFANAIIQKTNGTHVDADHPTKISDVPQKTQNKLRHFDWQKRDGTVESVDESVEEFEMVTMIEMTAEPIINAYPAGAAAKQIAEPAIEKFPEMAFSEFQPPERVGDVKSILWGAPESTTASLKNVMKAHQGGHDVKSEVEVFNGHLAKSLSTTTTPRVTTKMVELEDLEVEEFDLETFDNATLGAYNSTSTTTMSTLELVNLYSAEETTVHSILRARIPLKYVASKSQHSSAEQLDMLSTKEQVTSTTPAAKALEVASEAESLAAEPSTTKQSSMDKIMASMPSIDEDHVRTFTPRSKKAHGHNH